MQTVTTRIDQGAPVSDDELAARLKSGDLAAMEPLMRRHNQRLYRLARSILHNPDDAEEAVQEAYLTAFEKIADYRGGGAFAAWLGRITLNKAYDALRARSNVIPLDDARRGTRNDESGEGDGPVTSKQIASSQPDPERLAASSDLRRLIEGAIDSLSPEFRPVFMLRAIEGYSVEATAEQLDIPAATVRTRYFRARQQMQGTLGRALDDAMPTAFMFAGERCDRIVAGVLARLGQHSGP